MIKNRFKIALKLIIFLLITFLCVGVVNRIMMPGEFYNDMWPTSSTYEDFYKLKKNSVDVLVLGSSHMMSSINPLVIYDNYGVTSYNLASEQQSTVVSYYWLREALKYQSPKVVVLDSYMLYKYSDGYIYNDMNCSEGCVRKAMDYMRVSPIKLEAARAIEKIDPTQSALSYFFTNIRYHNRWVDLGEGDYTKSSLSSHGGLKGYTALAGVDPDLYYEPFADEDCETSDMEVMADTPKQYMDKIIKLCKDENIQLILVNIPCSGHVRRYKSTKEYAEENNIPYYDFNEEKLYKALDYNPSENLLAHPNYLGAEKISDYIGNILLNEYNVPKRDDTSFDKVRELYNHRIDNIKLSETTDLSAYLETINSDRYSVFIFGPMNYSNYLSDDVMTGLSELGLNAELNNVNNNTHYFAVKEGEKITEKLTEEDYHLSGSVRSGRTIYESTVDTKNMLEVCHVYSMKIDGKEYGGATNGLTFVIYDNEMRNVIDSVTFDTTVESCTSTRENQ